MVLRDLIRDYQIQKAYGIKRASYDFDINLLIQERERELAALNAKYEKSIAEERTKMIEACGKDPGCSHNLLVRFSSPKLGDIFICLGCRNIVAENIVCEEIIAVERPIENDEIATVLSLLEARLSQIYIENPEISLYDAVTMLTEYINTVRENKR